MAQNPFRRSESGAPALTSNQTLTASWETGSSGPALSVNEAPPNLYAFETVDKDDQKRYEQLQRLTWSSGNLNERAQRNVGDRIEIHDYTPSSAAYGQETSDMNNSPFETLLVGTSPFVVEQSSRHHSPFERLSVHGDGTKSSETELTSPFEKLSVRENVNTESQSTTKNAKLKIPLIRLSFVTAADQFKFATMFEAAVGNEKVLSGLKAKEMLDKSKLPAATLSQIWKLSDTTTSGTLHWPEFVLAMYLCRLVLVGKSLPSHISQNIAKEVASLTEIMHSHNVNKIRTWTDRTSSFKVDATLISCDGGVVRLHKTNGVKIAVPINKMSLDDLDYIEHVNKDDDDSSDDETLTETLVDFHQKRAMQAYEARNWDEAEVNLNIMLKQLRSHKDKDRKAFPAQIKLAIIKGHQGKWKECLDVLNTINTTSVNGESLASLQLVYAYAFLGGQDLDFAEFQCKRSIKNFRKHFKDNLNSDHGGLNESMFMMAKILETKGQKHEAEAYKSLLPSDFVSLAFIDPLNQSSQDASVATPLLPSWPISRPKNQKDVAMAIKLVSPPSLAPSVTQTAQSTMNDVNSTISSFVGIYRALYQYSGQGDDELSLTEGDLLCVFEKPRDGHLWKVKKHASPDEDEEPTGLVPEIYLQKAEPIALCKALFDYARTTDEELTFSEGTILDVYDLSDPDWLLAGYDGNHGFVPSNYVEAYPEASENKQLEIPPLPPLAYQDFDEHMATFEMNTSSDGLISRSVCANLNLPVESKIQIQVLGEIWQFVDEGFVGSLTLRQFIVWMHIIKCTMSGQLNAIPSQPISAFVYYSIDTHAREVVVDRAGMGQMQSQNHTKDDTISNKSSTDLELLRPYRLTFDQYGKSLIGSEDKKRKAVESAIQEGNTRLARILFEDLSTRTIKLDGWEEKPLHMAAGLGRLEIIRILVFNDVPVDDYDDHLKTPLHVAVMKGQNSAVSELIDLGASVEAPYGTHKLTTLHVAVDCSYKYIQDIVTLLLDYGGADVDALDDTREKRTPLDRVYEKIIDFTTWQRYCLLGKLLENRGARRNCLFLGPVSLDPRHINRGR